MSPGTPMSVLWYESNAAVSTSAVEAAKSEFDYTLDFGEYGDGEFDIVDHLRPSMGIFCSTIYSLGHGIRALRCMLEEEMPEQLVLYVPDADDFSATLLATPDRESLIQLISSKQLEIRDITDGRTTAS